MVSTEVETPIYRKKKRGHPKNDGKTPEYREMEVINILDMHKQQRELAKRDAQYIYVQADEIRRRLETYGIKDFVPDVEVALLMAIKGFNVAKCFYDGQGNMKSMETCYVPPNVHAAMVFLKTFCPEKYGQLDQSEKTVFVNNFISPKVAAADLDRISRVAGNLLTSKTASNAEFENADSTEKP